MKFHQQLLILVITSLLFISCKQKQEYLIPEDKMIDILVDIHVSDGVLNTESFTYDDKSLRPENYYKNVLDKHQINRLEFDSALAQYTRDRVNYLKMYEKVIEKLSIKQSLIQAQVNEGKELRKGEKFYYQYSTDYENKRGLDKKIQKSITNKESYTGKYSYEVKADVYSQSYHKLMQNPIQKIKFDVSCFVKLYDLQEVYPSIAFILEKDSHIISKQYVKLDKFIKKVGEWNEVVVSASLSLKTPESGVKVSVYFFNPKKEVFFIDDYNLKIKQIK
jgi:hypothetical protein